MAITAQEHSTPDSPQSPRSVRQPAAAWSSPSQLRKSLPIVRLIAEVWAIPEVKKIGIRVDGVSVHVWVVMPDDDQDAESKISAAERSYLNATMLHPFDLDVVPLSAVDEAVLPAFETVLER